MPGAKLTGVVEVGGLSASAEKGVWLQHEEGGFES